MVTPPACPKSEGRMKNAEISPICYLPSAICHLLSAICYLPSAICHLLSATRPTAVNGFAALLTGGRSSFFAPWF